VTEWIALFVIDAQGVSDDTGSCELTNPDRSQNTGPALIYLVKKGFPLFVLNRHRKGAQDVEKQKDGGSLVRSAALDRHMTENPSDSCVAHGLISNQPVKAIRLTKHSAGKFFDD
jgi:hypothetical protein